MLSGAEGVDSGFAPPSSLGFAGSLLFWRPLSLLDVTQKGLVCRRSVLVAAVIDVPLDLLWGLVAVVVLFVSFVGVGRWVLVIVPSS